MTDVNDLNFPNLDTKGMFSRENLLNPVLQHNKNCIAHDAIGTMQGVVIYFSVELYLEATISCRKMKKVTHLGSCWACCLSCSAHNLLHSLKYLYRKRCDLHVFTFQCTTQYISK